MQKRVLALERDDHREVFAELYVRDMEQSINIFCGLIGFVLNRRDGDFAELEHGRSRLLLNSQDVSKFDETNPIRRLPADGNRGLGVELGIVVPDVDLIYRQLSATGAVTVASGLKDREWGSRDFRIIHPDGFYIRISS